MTKTQNMSKTKSAETRIIDFLRENPDWYAAAYLQRLEFHNKDGTTASPKAISRRLQENAEGEQAMLDVEYRGKNAAWYRIKEQHIKPRYEYKEIQLPNGQWIVQETKIVPEYAH